MEKFFTEFKNKAHSKTLTSADMVAHCFVKAIKAKSENKLEIAEYFARKAFTPRYGSDYQAFYSAKSSLRYLTSPSKLYKNGEWVEQPRKLLGIPFEEIFTPEQIEMFDTLIKEVRL